LLIALLGAMMAETVADAPDENVEKKAA